MKTLLYFLVAIFIAIPSIAQKELKKPRIKKNTLAVHYDQFYFKPLYRRIHWSTFGISYTRRIFKKYSLSLSWNKYRYTDGIKSASTGELIWRDKSVEGKLESRGLWRFAEMEFDYLYPFLNNHQLSIGIGPSFTQTENSYVERTSVIYLPQPHFLSTTYYYKTEQYWGVLLAAHYNYRFWKDRITAGLDFRLRFYKNIPFKYDVYGIHVGYNF